MPNDLLIVAFRNIAVAIAIGIVYKFFDEILSIYFFVYGFVLGYATSGTHLFGAFLITLLGSLEMFVLLLSLRKSLIFVALYVPLAILEYLAYTIA